MNITEHEMRGLLTGKCLPGDMRVNEELPAYLVRKFAELKAQRDALAAENAVMLKLLTDISEQYQEVQTESEENAAVIDLDYISEVNTYVSRDVDGENPLLATDAYLNSVRADAVQALWDDSLNDVGHVLEEIGAYQDASEAGGIVHSEIQERVDDFVAQLRAGKDGE